MKCVAITGAGSGIGQALALYYAKSGWRVIGFDKSEKRLLETTHKATGASGRFQASLLDLAEEEDGHRIVKILQRREGVDVFIHNAAVNLVGPFEDLPFRKQQALINLNLTVPMKLTRDLLAAKLIRKGGTLVYLSSLSTFVGYPGAAVYAATKDALAHYARSLRVALKPQGIHVLTVYPGPARTPMASQCSPQGDQHNRKRMPPEIIAHEIAIALEHRKSECVPGFKNRIFAWMGSLMPGVMGQAMRRIIYDRLDLSQNPHGLDSSRRPD